MMATSTDIDDETLMAYADGELDAAQAAQVEQRLVIDASAAAKVAEHQSLRARLGRDSTSVLSEPIPERLLAALQPRAAHTAVHTKVVDLAQRKPRKSFASNWSMREWGAMAASLIAGLALGMYALNFNGKPLVSADHGALIAQGKLDTALTTQLTSAAGSAQAVQIGISFRNHAGDYCRSFTVRDDQPLAGLACRSQNQWRVQLLTETAKGNSGELRQAASATPEAVLALIDQQIAGEALDADAEMTARKAGWR
jgi:hypothetical protein